MRRKHSTLDVLLAALFCLALLGPMALGVASHGGVDLPHRLAGGDAAYLEGAREEADIHLSLHAFAKKELQQGVEAELTSNTPFRADALLASAAFQRASIRLSNIPFDWAAYPTYYGSDLVYIPSVDAVTGLPRHASQRMDDGVDWFCEALAGFAERHPQNSFYLVVPCGGGCPTVSPVYGLMSDPLTGPAVVERMRANLSNVDNVTLISDDDAYQTSEEYYQAYFRTDHHWNIRGAELLYQRLALAQGKEPESFGEIIDAPGLLMSGSNARNGLMLVREPVPIAPDAFEDVSFTFQNGTTLPANEIASIDPDDPRYIYNFYDKYYRRPVMTTSDAEGTVLLVRDSFGNAFIAPLASLYHTMTHANSMREATDDTLDSLMEEAGADDVVFVCGPLSIALMDSRNPGFFD